MELTNCERTPSREHPSAVKYGTSQEEHFKLSFDFRYKFHTKKNLFSHLELISVMNRHGSAGPQR